METSASLAVMVPAAPCHPANLRGGENMKQKRTYERPTLTSVGSFKKTGLGTNRGPERVVGLRFSL